MPRVTQGAAEYRDPGLCCGTPSRCKDRRREASLRTLKGYHNKARGRRTGRGPGNLREASARTLKGYNKAQGRRTRRTLGNRQPSDTRTWNLDLRLADRQPFQHVVDDTVLEGLLSP